jgi:hypothetical protein
MTLNSPSMRKFIVSSLFIFFTSNILAQINGFPNVNAGSDVFLNCSTGNCTDLTVDFLETGETTSYEVNGIGIQSAFSD